MNSRHNLRSISSEQSDDSLTDMLYNGVVSEMPKGEKDGKIKMEKDMSCGEGPEELFFILLFRRAPFS